MSYRYKVLSDLPTAYYPLEEISGTTATDVSGNAQNGTFSAAPTVFSSPLVNNGLAPQAFTNASRTATLPFSTRAWDVASPDEPFSIELWVNPVVLTATSSLVKRTATDGLSITTKGFTFTVTGILGAVTLTYNPERMDREFYVVATFDRTQLSLSLNGVRVKTVPFNDKISTSGSTTLIVGSSTGPSTDQIYIGHVALYKTAINDDTVKSHYDYGTLTAGYVGAIVQDAAVYYTLDDTETNISLLTTEASRENLLEAETLTNLTYDDGRLVQFNVAATATRTKSYGVDHIGVIDGSRLDWGGNSAFLSVDVSLDGGSTWTAATNHSTIPGLGKSVDTTGKVLVIRVNYAIPSGSDIPYIRYLSFTIYSNKNADANMGSMRGTLVDPVDLSVRTGEVLPYSEHKAAKFSGGYFVTGLPNAATPIYAVEAWIKVNSISASVWQYLIDARVDAGAAYLAFNPTPAITSGGWSATYINGVAKTPTTADFPVGTWVHFLGTINAGLVGRVALASRFNFVERANASYMYPAVYYTLPNAAAALNHYQSGLGVPFVSQLDPKPAGINEISTVAYKYSWSTSGT